MTAADFLVPAKFLLIVFQLMMAIIIYYTKEDNIFAGIPLTSVYGSSDYNSANTRFNFLFSIEKKKIIYYISIMGAITLSLIFLIIELLLLFTGLTLYLHRLNSFRALLYAWFILGSWSYNTLWILWGLLSLLPLLLESITAGSSVLYFRKLNR